MDSVDLPSFGSESDGFCDELGEAILASMAKRDTIVVPEWKPDFDENDMSDREDSSQEFDDDQPRKSTIVESKESLL